MKTDLTLFLYFFLFGREKMTIKLSYRSCFIVIHKLTFVAQVLLEELLELNPTDSGTMISAIRKLTAVPRLFNIWLMEVAVTLS